MAELKLPCDFLLYEGRFDDGRALQAIAKTYSPDNMGDKTLQEFIIYFGILELILSQLPDIHTLRFVNAIATFCTVAFTLIATGVSVHDGESLLLTFKDIFSSYLAMHVNLRWSTAQWVFLQLRMGRRAWK